MMRASAVAAVVVAAGEGGAVVGIALEDRAGVRAGVGQQDNKHRGEAGRSARARGGHRGRVGRGLVDGDGEQVASAFKRISGASHWCSSRRIWPVRQLDDSVGVDVD